MTDRDQDHEEIIALCNELSAASAGYKNRVVFKSILNILATTIANACATQHEAEKATEETIEALTTAVKRYWQAAHVK